VLGGGHILYRLRREKKVQSYYKQNRKEIENKKIVISERLTDEQGNAVVWEIRALSQKENENILKKYYLEWYYSKISMNLFIL